MKSDSYPFHAGATSAWRALHFALNYNLHQALIAPARYLGFDIPPVRRGNDFFAVEQRVVAHTPFCKLIRFSSGQGAANRRLICAPIAGHRAVQLRQIVEELVADGDVYLTDWTDARDIPQAAGRFGLDENVLCILEFLQMLEPDGLDVLAICQATLPTFAAICLSATRSGHEPRSLLLIGGPMDARKHPTQLATAARHVSADEFLATCVGPIPVAYPGAGRLVYPGFLQSAAMTSGQTGRQWGLALDAGVASCRNSPAETASAFHAMITHCAGTTDLPAELVLDIIDVVFQRFMLARGIWRVAGEPIMPARLNTMRLFTLEGAADRIIGAGQTHAAIALCPGISGVPITLPDCDHYDLLGGRRWRHVVLPVLLTCLSAARETAHDTSTYSPGASPSAPCDTPRDGTNPVERSASQPNQQGHHDPS